MYTADDLQNLSEADKKKQRQAIQVQIIMLESDGRKFLNEKNVLDAEIRNIRMDTERLRIGMEERKKRLEKVSYQIKENEAERIKLKKKLNLL